MVGWLAGQPLLFECADELSVLVVATVLQVENQEAMKLIRELDDQAPIEERVGAAISSLWEGKWLWGKLASRLCMTVRHGKVYRWGICSSPDALTCI